MIILLWRNWSCNATSFTPGSCSSDINYFTYTREFFLRYHIFHTSKYVIHRLKSFPIFWCYHIFHIWELQDTTDDWPCECETTYFGTLGNITSNRILDMLEFPPKDRTTSYICLQKKVGMKEATCTVKEMLPGGNNLAVNNR